MPVIPPIGNKYDFYACEGNETFAVFPGGLIEDFDDPAPIKLQRGDKSWGARHIATKHGAWLDKSKVEVHEMVWRKLREAGAIYGTEDEGKLKLSLRISPTSLLILRFIAAQKFFTVVSAYAHPAHLDGTEIGRWPGHRESGPMPAFCLPVPPPDPIVKVKKRREFELPAVTKG